MSWLTRSILALVVSGSTALAADAWTPSAPEAELIRALSARDGAPSCAELEAMVPAPVTSMQAIVEHVTMPPWVGMRAADCLVTGHATEIRPVIEGWVTHPDLKGLRILALGQLDAMPADVAVAIATKAIQAGPDAADARRRVARSSRPEIAALATTLPATPATAPATPAVSQ